MCKLLVGLAVLTLAGGACRSQGEGLVDAGPSDGGPTVDRCLLPPMESGVATLSGCVNSGVVDGIRGTARFSNPVNVALGQSGIVYVADFDSNRLRRIDGTGKVSTIVSSVELNRPFGLAVSPEGFLYVQADGNDRLQHTIDNGTLWRVTPSTGEMKLIFRDHGRPRGLALLTDGRIATADHMHHVIEIVDPATGLISPLAGIRDVAGHANSPVGANATFAQPWDLVVGIDGDLIVTEFDNHMLRRVTLTGEVADFAGTGVPGHRDGPIATAQFFEPKGIAIDARGVLYVTEAGNHVVRKIENGMVSTVAGIPSDGGYVDDPNPLQAQFYGVEGIDVSADGTRLIVADGNNGDGMPFHSVRVVTP